jgi:hypothetical protein
MYEIAAVNTSPYRLFLSRKKNTWYSINNGEWNSPQTWVSNSVDRGSILCPQVGDDVYINHIVNYSNNNPSSVYQFNRTIKNLYIGPNGKLTNTSVGLNLNWLQITGDLQCSGTIDFGTTASTITLELQGNNNFFLNFIPGTQSTIYYSSTQPQNIVNVTYYTLNSDNSTKTAVADLTINGQLNVNSGIVELSSNNAYFYGTVSVAGILSKNSAIGSVNFYSALTIANSSGIIAFTGNPIINMHGNFSGDCRSGCNFGTNTWNILENLYFQINGGGNVPINTGSNSVVIASGKTLTINGLFGSTTNNQGGWINSGMITGVDGTATLNVIGTYAYGSSNVAMPVGTFNYNYGGFSNIQIQSGVTMNLPFISYYALTINGNAALYGNTIIGQNCAINGSLECLTYNFTCSGTLSYPGNFTKNGSGTITLQTINCQGSTGKIDFSAGNPTVNISGNLTGDVRAGLNFGNGTVNITANSSFSTWIGGNSAVNMVGNILIAPGVTFTNIGLTNTAGGINMTGTINGVDNTSIFVNQSVFGYSNSTAPMITGKLYCNQAVNTFYYQLLGNQNIQVPSDPTSSGYYNLTLSGLGNKTLLGNISIKNIYTLTSPATLNSNGFALTNP